QVARSPAVRRLDDGVQVHDAPVHVERAKVRAWAIAGEAEYAVGLARHREKIQVGKVRAVVPARHGRSARPGRKRYRRAIGPSGRKVQFNNRGPVDDGRLHVAREEDPGAPVRSESQVGVWARKIGPGWRSIVVKHIAQGRPRPVRPAVGAVGPLYG